MLASYCKLMITVPQFDRLSASKQRPRPNETAWFALNSNGFYSKRNNIVVVDS